MIVSESWVNHVIVDAQDPVVRAEIGQDFLRKKLPGLYRSNDLQKTAFEFRALNETVGALNALRARLGFPRVTFSPERIHIISLEEARRILPSGADGQVVYGHAYVMRRDRQWRFLHDLTHEIAHLASYSSLRVSLLPDGKQHISRCKLGLYEKSNFRGINEGATEIAASEMRSTLARSSSLLGPVGFDKLVSSFAYAEHVSLTRRLCDLVGGGSKRGKDELLGDYFRGTSRFMQSLCGMRPAAKDILAVMDESSDAARFAAEKLGIIL